MMGMESVALRILGKRRRTQKGLLLAGLGLGAGIMYLLDPDRGARRRALVRDQAIHAARRTAVVVDKGARDLEHRARGALIEARARHSNRAVLDDVLVERVRARLGHLVSHPRAIEVEACDGRVNLCGQVLASEVEDLLRGVESVRGVRSVDHRLYVYRTAEDVPSLQGESRRANGERLGARRWPPRTRLLAGALAAGLVTYGAARRGRVGAALASIGALMLLRDVYNLPIPTLLGAGASEIERGLAHLQTRGARGETPARGVDARFTDLPS